MKHTYLYPIEGEAERWLWMAGRYHAADLFADPPPEAPDSMWLIEAEIADALGAARNALHALIEDRDRICIGRHYMIPGSRGEVSQSREREASHTVRKVTATLWDAPFFGRGAYVDTRASLKMAEGEEGRDPWEEISAFLLRHRVTKDNGKRTRVVPVWM